MSISVNAPSSNVVSQYYGLQWITKNSSVIKPEYRRQLYEKYGKGVGARDIFFVAESIVDVPNQVINTFQKEAPLFVVKLGSAISTGSAGTDITVILDSTCYDSSDNGPLRVGDDIYIPTTYLTAGTLLPRAYRVTSISGTGASAEYTCKPYAKDGGFYTTASRIVTEVPAATYLMIGANSFAAGTGQPAGQTDTLETLSFYPRILKESFDIEGGQIAQSFYEATGMEGSKALLNQALMETEFKLDVKESRFFTFGERTDNSTMTQTSESTVSNAVVSGAGLFPHADKYGQKLSYTGDFVLDNLYEVGILQASQGITNGTSVVMVGQELGRDVEADAYELIKGYSGGTDLLDKVKKEFGLDVNAFFFDGRTYVIWRPSELADPTGAGLYTGTDYAYNYATMGLVVPKTNVTMDFMGQRNKTFPNVQIGYVNRNGENRRRVLSYNKGVNGIEGMGQDVSSGYDGVHGYMLAHMTPIFALPSQWVLMYK
jgi:hypothetical protein